MLTIEQRVRNSIAFLREEFGMRNTEIKSRVDPLRLDMFNPHLCVIGQLRLWLRVNETDAIESPELAFLARDDENFGQYEEYEALTGEWRRQLEGLS